MHKKHVKDLDELDEHTLKAVMNASVLISRALKRLYNLDGISITQNGGVFNDLGHYHMHVFPRYKDDGFGWVEPIDKRNTDLKRVRANIIDAIQSIEKK
ncbi:HIT family protein [Paenibacillus agilis]|uniref:HIT family protein n=2 Tax=Paenibacillus agilis TaxID=3020863 RepID=A0A559J053_9BACL|nr:HIT family protein [Paenibacillus agilis]